MKFNTIRLILLLCVISFTLSLGTSTQTATSTNTHTNAKTQAKTSIFSYDFLSVMKKKMQMLKAKGLSSNKETYKSVTRQDSPVPSDAQPSSPSPSNANPTQDAATSTVNSESGPIFYNGWLKFFKFDERLAIDGSKPNSFFKNHEFTNQRRTVKDLDITARDSEGVYENVPEETYFFATLFLNKLVFANSKREKVKKAFETIDFDDITPIPEGDKFAGGLNDMGNFSEGYCFKINTKQFMTWILCSESVGDKSKLMELIKKMKIKSQRDNGMLVGDEDFIKKNNNSNGDSIARMINSKEETEQRRSNLPKKKANVTSAYAEDGYWIILQEWSQCSKKCDGGISTLHRLCVPPKHGGRPCEGKAVTTRPCNTQACPKSSESKELEDALNGGKTLKPIIKVMPFTNRPTRTRVCIIKEGDLMLTKPQPELTYVGAPKARAEQIPVRAIMNNRTISFYENADDMTSHFATYNLKTADFARSERDKLCFVISENKKSTELCGIGLDREGKTYKEWDRDFHIFKFNCETKPDTIDLLLNDKLKQKIKDAKDQMLVEREEMIKEKTKKEEENTKFSVLKKTNKIAQDAISKEQNMEDLIQKEEEERERREEIQLQEEIEKEKKKNECVMHAIKERELENQYQMKTKETEKEVDNIKKQAMEEVIAKRNRLKDKITEMRKKSQRKSAKLKQQLMTMRMSMAKEMTDVYKDGDSKLCVNAMADEQSRINYCTANFNEIVKFGQCKDNDDFCTLCCENEFGEMHMDKRNKCIKNICEVQAIKKEEAQGNWIWANPIQN